MRLESRGEFNVEGVVSRRNLLALLQKCHTDSSSKTISITGHPANASLTGVMFTLRVESDEKHYGTRPVRAGDTAMYAEAALQIATDLIQQVADALPQQTGESDGEHAYFKSSLDKTATQVQFLANHIGSRSVGVR
jgi:hypothetical protein